MKNSFFQYIFLTRLIIFILIHIVLISCQDKTDADSKGLPDDALSTFELEPGFRIDLIAAEPLLGDPVDMEIDEYGRLYVVEMPGYPLDKSGSGKIKLLSDTNGDGRMDKSALFAEGLMLPNSIMRWKKGVLVTDAPNVLYLEDSNGDGRAEIKDTLLTGFALSNPQHNLNSPVLGIDNWIYLGHERAVGTETYKEEFGDPGADIFFPSHPPSPRLGINANGRSVRFRPDQYALEISSSNTQFGHTFDPWGHHFLVSNANHIIQEVIAETYLRRNPDLLISDATESLSDHEDAAEVFPITLNPEHQLLTDVGVITSACGITYYSGGAFPELYNSNVTFVAEPVANLIHVDKLQDKGAAFTASRMLAHKEFLASTDAKFRPVNMYIGPDGALYVVDYYRQIIEHPEWMSDDVVKSGKLYNDMDKGRIYRISADDSRASDWTKGLQLGDASGEELVKNLASPNSWWRLNSQRLLVDRADKKTVPALIQMAKNESPAARLHALWTLEGMAALTYKEIEQALNDPVPGVRENAIKLAELHLSEAPGLTKSLLTLQGDPDAKVRYQLLCTLGFVNTAEASQIRNKILFGDIDDKWVQIAALSSSSAPGSLLQVVLDNFKEGSPAYASLVQRLATMIGASGSPENIRQLVQKATKTTSSEQGDWQASVLEGLAGGMENKKSRAVISDAEENQLIQRSFENPSDRIRKASLQLLKVIGIKNEARARKSVEDAISIAKDPSQAENKRAQAIDFVSVRNPAPHAIALMKLFVPTEPLSVQLAALRTLSFIPDTTISGYLLRQWPVLTPEIREAAVNTFLANDDRIAMLLNAIESGKIQTTDIIWHRKVRLMAQDNEKLRNQARALFTKNNDKEVNEAYQHSLELKGNPVKGKEIYQQQCALCHQIRGTMGITLGPDLGTIHNWSPEAIMANILAPNLSISSGYDLWAIEMKSGESIQGIIASETPGAITIRNTGSMEKTINRRDIKSLKAMNMSVMTSGLEKQINQQQMADLLAFLKQNK